MASFDMPSKATQSELGEEGDLLLENDFANTDCEFSRINESYKGDRIKGTSCKVKKKHHQLPGTVVLNTAEVSLLITNCVTHIRILYGIILSLVLVIVVGASILQQELNEFRIHFNYHSLDVSVGNSSIIDQFLYSWNNPTARKVYSDSHRGRRHVSRTSVSHTYIKLTANYSVERGPCAFSRSLTDRICLYVCVSFHCFVTESHIGIKLCILYIYNPFVTYSINEDLIVITYYTSIVVFI